MELNSELERLQKYLPIEAELQRAIKKFPTFPDDIFHQIAIVNEESGEATRAVLHYQYEGGGLEDVRIELIQTAAMCIRMLDKLNELKP